MPVPTVPSRVSASARRHGTPIGSIAGLLVLLLAACGQAGGTHALAVRGERPCDVLLVTLDTTRADRLGCYGHTAARTPRLDALAAGGVRFDQATSPCPLTLPSHATLLTGTVPPEHELRDNGRAALGADLPHLAQVFTDRGFRTGAVVGAAVLDRAFGLDRGFDVYDDAMAEPGTEPMPLQRDARAVTDAALAWLDADDGRPTFLWVHYYDPHSAYEPPAPFDELTDPYDGELAWVDSQLGRLFDRLRASGRLERTLVVVTSDHGEALGEHGEETHGVLVYQATQRVPLIVSLPGAVLPGRVELTPVALADVFPTLLELYDWPVPPRVSGRSFAAALSGAEIAPRPIYAESEYSRLNFGWSALHSLRVGDWKVIRSPHPELYDLATDPGETRDLAAADPARRDELLAALEGYGAALVPYGTAAGDVDAEVVARIAALGYAQGARAATSQGAFDGRDPARFVDLLNRYHDAATRVKVGDAAGAVEELKEIARTCPEAAQFRFLLGLAYRGVGRDGAARAELEAALAADPRYDHAHHELAKLLRDSDPGRALEHFELAASLNPANEAARLEAANLRVARRELEPALAHFEVLVERRPDDGQLRLSRAYLLRALGRHVEMIAQVEEALRRAPGDHALAAYLAWELATNPEAAARDGERAVRLASAECQRTTRRDPDALDTLAAALAEAGRYEEAQRTAAEAVELARRTGRSDLVAQIEARLQGYRRGEPFRAR